MKKHVFTENAPKPIGPYSQAVATKGSFLFISGQIPLKPDGSMADSDIVSQTRQACENIKAILAQENLTLDDVVKTTVLLKNMDDFKAMNEVYNEYFCESKPARAAYQVSKLPLDVMIEIESIAVIND